MARAKRVEAAAALVDILEREGVDAIFGVPGGPLLPFLDRLLEHTSIRVIITKHEQAAAYAAFAYARVTGRLGVCFATLGPGATNLLAGLPVALVESAPVLAISGQVQTTAIGRGAHQESSGWYRTPDQEAMFRATCKHTATCTDVTTFADHVRASIRIATSGRPGPAHLIIPANLLHQKAHFRSLEPAQYRIAQERTVDAVALEVIAERVSRSRFPLLFAGARAMQPWAGDEIQALSEAWAIPVIADLGSKSIVDEWSPTYLGCAGVMGQRAGERYLKDRADLVIAVGQSFDEIATLSSGPDLRQGSAHPARYRCRGDRQGLPRHGGFDRPSTLDGARPCCRSRRSGRRWARCASRGHRRAAAEAAAVRGCRCRERQDAATAAEGRARAARRAAGGCARALGLVQVGALAGPLLPGPARHHRQRP